MELNSSVLSIVPSQAIPMSTGSPSFSASTSAGSGIRTLARSTPPASDQSCTRGNSFGSSSNAVQEERAKQRKDEEKQPQQQKQHPHPKPQQQQQQQEPPDRVESVGGAVDTAARMNRSHGVLVPNNDCNAASRESLQETARPLYGAFLAAGSPRHPNAEKKQLNRRTNKEKTFNKNASPDADQVQDSSALNPNVACSNQHVAQSVEDHRFPKDNSMQNKSTNEACTTTTAELRTKRNRRRRKKAPLSQSEQLQEREKAQQPSQQSTQKKNSSPKSRAMNPNINSRRADNGNKVQSKNNNRKKNNKNNNSFYWWKQHIPTDAIDPITLDALRSLRYPPFALVAAEPYVPIPEWPIREATEQQSLSSVDNNNTSADRETEQERQQRILQEQWGELLQQQQQQPQAAAANTMGADGAKPKPTTIDTMDTSESIHDKVMQQKQATSTTTVPLHERHVNLFDGRALAYYMVSQLQFIDPLNRRDLTRDELVQLDRYLRRHGFGQEFNVTEAYDTKGITLSTAGAAAQTAAGRAAILQQEARNLLNALFHRGIATEARSTTTNKNRSQKQSQQQQPQPQQTSNFSNYDNNSNNPLMRQYQVHQGAMMRQQLQRMGQSVPRTEEEQDTGIYGDDGFMIIDDDVNPGLRGANAATISSYQNAINRSHTSLFGSDLQNTWHRHGYQRPREPDQEFPTLAAAVPSATSSGSVSDEEKLLTKKLPMAKTLQKIGDAVKRTDPEELQRQWEARELARKKAMLSNLTYGSNPASWDGPSLLTPSDHQLGIPSQITAIVPNASTLGPTEGQIERNKAIADALGVQPATIRSSAAASLTSGWARPTAVRVELDEFGRELNTTIYPDELIVKAREHHMTALLKLEKKWINFLEDDSAASLPLNRMESSLRAFVHEYATYWKIESQSYDPEPNRYIHCTKQRDTRAPYPLLSDAIRSWKGPKPLIKSLPNSTRQQQCVPQVEHPSVQTAGQSTRSGRELPAPPERKPLSLKPRSIAELAGGMEKVSIDSAPSSGGGVSIGGAPSRTMTESLVVPAESRFGALLGVDRERPKLDLKPRTLPLETPPLTTTLSSTTAEELTRQRERVARREQKEREKAEQKRRILEAAFASDDEQSTSSSMGNKQNLHPKSIDVRNENIDDDSEWEEQEPLYTGDD